MPLHPTNFPDGLTATSALTKVFTAKLEQDAGTIASIDHMTREHVVSLTQHRAKYFYHAEEFSQETLSILDPEHYMHGHKICRAVAEVFKQPFRLPESLNKPKRFRRVDHNWRDELATVVNENEDPNAASPVIKFQLYWRVVVLKSGTSLTQLFQQYKTLRSDDDAWCDAVADFAEDHMPPLGEPLALHCVGITIRHPSLRAEEPTEESHLAFHLRRHRNFVDTERLLRTLLHIPALNVAMGGLDQVYRTRSAINALVTAAAARAAQDLQDIPARISQGNASAVFEEAMAISSSGDENPKALAIGQLVDNLQGIGPSGQVITMTRGKDVTKEAVRFQVPHDDVEVGGVGPRVQERHCEAWIDQVFAALYQGSGGVEVYQALRDVLLGPFRDGCCLLGLSDNVAACIPAGGDIIGEARDALLSRPVAGIPGAGYTAYLVEIRGNRTMRGVNWRQPPVAAVSLEPQSLHPGWDWDPADLIAFATALTDLTLAIILFRETNSQRDQSRAERMWWQLACGLASNFLPLGGMDHDSLHWPFPGHLWGSLSRVLRKDSGAKGFQVDMGRSPKKNTGRARYLAEIRRS
ncbi:hypothetical protein HDU88_008140 [Geranomyces variabilis]|nr:hypothetical protein HDU88_008140 [Geranomyces variabilis]